ncbi:ATP-binding protein [Candidatus Latescibacterota bacterium]
MKRCKICGGTGIIYDRDIKAGSYGELKICPCIEKQCTCNAIPPYQVFDKNGDHSWCACRWARIKLETTKKAFRESRIPQKYKWKFIEDFDTDSKKTNSTKANKIIGNISTIKDMQSHEKWKKGFYFWGSAGSGKTLLACITLQELMLKYARGGRFIDLSRQFFQRLKSSYDITDASFGTAGQILDELIEIPFLVIDDFGTQRNTEWELEMLYNLIDSRYEEERITIITSNMIISQFKEGYKEETKPSFNSSIEKQKEGKMRKYNPIDMAKGRVQSRILEMCRIIEVDLPDYRATMSQFI